MEFEDRISKVEDILSQHYDDVPEDNLTDLLADCMHFCSYEKIDFNLCLSRAQMHFRAEKGE